MRGILFCFPGNTLCSILMAVYLKGSKPYGVFFSFNYYKLATSTGAIVLLIDEETSIRKAFNPGTRW